MSEIADAAASSFCKIVREMAQYEKGYWHLLDSSRPLNEVLGVIRGLGQAPVINGG